ncbi:MAG TPA: CoA transferase [Candidatus Binatia bacterium]|nr:CoA transferase [Candidatus Binatia bacterium]
MAQLFDGVNILEFGGGAAGPFGTRYFADHGATVVRVESRQRPDFVRLLRYTPGDPAGVDGSHMFAMININKFGVALNMSHPKGPEIARRLVQWADVVAENFAPKAMAKWGLDYESLRRLKPDLIMISTCLNGQTGPERNYPGFGGQGSAISGFNHLTGWPDLEPLGPYGTITDSLSPRFVALLVASALIHRRRTGQGQYIDLAQVEGGVVCLSESIATYSATGEALARMGNRSRHAAPHGAFRCAPKDDDDDRWVAIAIHSDDDWRRFARAIGDPAWTHDKRFATTSGRLAHVDELEERIGTWTRAVWAEDVMHTLQAAGIDSGLVANFEDLVNDPQLAHRRHFREVEHRVIGTHLVETNGMRFSRTPEDIRMAAPCLGEHSEYVYRELLGMSVEEYAALNNDGVFE